MKTNSPAPEGKGAFSPKVTDEIVNDLKARIEQSQGRVEIRALPVINTEEVQMAGYFIIAQPRRK